MADNNSDPDADWKRPNIDPDAVFGSTAATAKDLNDYVDWANSDPPQWKKLKASVVGVSATAISGAEKTAIASGIVDAQSLADAYGAFQYAYELLSWLESFIYDQAHAIAGEDRAWAGVAAEAFLAKMQLFADYLGANAERIAGGGGSGGTGSVPDQLWNSANYLAWAQNAMETIDVGWAEIAKANGAGVTDTGLVAISSTEYVKPMTAQMFEVVDTLAGQYQLTYGRVVPPTPSQNFQTTPPTTTTRPTTTPPATTTKPPTTTTKPPPPKPSPTKPPTGTPPPTSTKPPTTTAKPPTVTPPPTKPSLTAPVVTPPVTPRPSATVPPVATPPVTRPPVSTSAPVVTPPVTRPPSRSPVVTPPPKPTVTAPVVTPPVTTRPPVTSPPVVTRPPTPLPVGSPRPPGGTPPVTTPPPRVDRPGGPPSAPTGTPPPRSGGVPDGQNGGGLPGFEAPGVDAPPTVDPPGVDGPGGLAPPVLGGVDPPDATGGGRPDGTSGAPPFLPPPSGAPGGAGGGAPDRPDASGLVEGEPQTWDPPLSGGVDVPHSPGGTEAGGSGLGASPLPPAPAATGGVPPFLPPPSGAPGGAGGGAPDRPDASGLVEGEPQTWQPPVPDGVDAPDAPQGAPAGGSGLPPVVAPPAAPADPDGRAAPERPDAAELLDPEPGWHQDLPVPVPLPVPSRAAGPQGDPEPQRKPGAKRAAGPERVPGPERAVDPPGGPAAPVRPGWAAAPVGSVPGPGEREKAERPEAAELLIEAPASWAADDAPAPDRVPVVRPTGEPEDTSAWDAPGERWWLAGADLPAADPDRADRGTDA
ncbi:collagen, type I/II/III/V/XI/XXIV/XXVII, alpha [Micromonospora haikouensis]|uniref:Collagen, type I/II/III/V/XI/XXIV/XXVII, alpha n=1 Tax=Micromonospora haikouensis TaxID=686309 RepID=A0A1C4WPJ7_9ACTN|nr:hypothetical protein [Micromonospora haikouensis]SCE98112.1 collagen, type I/II/III/V/XI/XXIV/XXVII, alpha [Micromonospora haikouensis]